MPYVTHRPREKLMGYKFRHSKLGGFHKLDQTKASVSTVLVPDAALTGLIRYLNDGEESEDHKRVLTILKLMLEVGNIDQPVWDERFEGPMRVSRHGRYVLNPALKKIAPAKYDSQFRIDQKEESINREFARYRFSPRINCWSNKCWNVTWLIRAKEPRKAVIHSGLMRLDDGTVLQLMLDLARAGYLGRLRRCAYCEKWLYAKFRHQDYCSTKCQQEHYRKSEEWRSKRRIYMRDYRNRDRKLNKTSPN